jgi:hypothetical protein
MVLHIDVASKHNMQVLATTAVNCQHCCAHAALHCHAHKPAAGATLTQSTTKTKQTQASVYCVLPQAPRGLTHKKHQRTGEWDM